MRLTIALLCSASALIFSSPVFAQTAQPLAGVKAETQASAEETPATAQDIVVTGSRIIRNGNNSPSPVTVVPTQEILKVQPGTLADALNTLPIFAGSRGQASNPSSTGNIGAGNAAANQLNLRNLGSNRNLVLLDGLRIPPTLVSGGVDVDLIPQMLIQRVDLVTGGVSAVYGSDAVSGVINYIIDKKFNGLLAEARRGISQRGDAQQVDLGIAAGTSLFNGRAHIEVSYEYRDDKGIPYRSSRSSQRQWTVEGAGTAANPFQLLPNVRLAGSPFGGLITTGAAAGQTFKTNGVLSPFVAGVPTGTACCQVGGDGGYYDSSMTAPLRSHQIFGRLDYEFTDTIHGYVQAAGNIKKNSIAAEYPLLNNLTVSSINAFLSPVVRAAVAGAPTFRFSELVSGVPRYGSRSDSNQWVYLAGIDGKLGEGFSWGVSYVRGETKLDTTLVNDTNNQRLAAALDAVINPANGQIVCNVSLTNSAYANCVPINLFGPTAVTPAAQQYVFGERHYQASTTTNDFAAHVEGNPFSTWAGPVGVALSAEYRNISYTDLSDSQPSDLADCTGLRFNCTQGTTFQWFAAFPSGPQSRQRVTEGAVELNVPLVKDFPFIRSLDVSGAARYTHYDTSGNYWTWKLGLDWHITDKLRIRGTRSRDIRAPTLYDLFAPTALVTTSVLDRLTNLTPTVKSVNRSNPNLTAEIGNTLTAGIVWTPKSNLSVALDYYHIKVSDAITTVTGDSPTYQTACYASGGTSVFCSLQTRPNGFQDTSPANVVTSWIGVPINISEVETFGVDLEVNYSTQLFNRPMSLRFLGAYQPHIYVRIPSTVTVDQGGAAFGPVGVAAAPRLRLTGIFSFQLADHVTVDILQRWRNPMKLSGDPSQVWINNRMDAFATTNVNLSVDTETPFGKAEFYINVRNLFDQDPPPGGFSGNSARPGLREGFAVGDDLVGRYFTFGFKIKL